MSTDPIVLEMRWRARAAHERRKAIAKENKEREKSLARLEKIHAGPTTKKFSVEKEIKRALEFPSPLATKRLLNILNGEKVLSPSQRVALADAILRLAQ